jgi:hypothetical protein
VDKIEKVHTKKNEASVAGERVEVFLNKPKGAKKKGAAKYSK